MRTAHGLGYAFCGPLPSEEYPPTLPPADCWLLFREGRVPLGRGEHLIGRSSKSVVPIDDRTISRHHARIVVGDEVTLVDLGSRNGTYVNAERVSAPRPLKHGDRLTVGSLLITVLMPDSMNATTAHKTHPTDDAQRDH